MRLWQCSHCEKVGLWGPGWQSFSSFVVDDEWPSYRVVACSKACEETIEWKRQQKEIQLPKFRRSGGFMKLVRGPVGYKPQPDQKKLARIWNEKHPDDQINLELIR